LSSNVVIDCPQCSVRVNAPVRGEVHDRESESAVVLAACPSCGGPLVGMTQLFQNEHNDWQYEHADRVWPAPTTVELSLTIPQSVRRDIKDAQKCIAHGIYSAAVVLCGKALERLAKERAPGKTLAEGLSALKTSGVIDERLSLWASALRKERNIGAHASEEEVSKENAQDVLDFTVAIFEYVYTLSEKYAEFMARKAAPKK
jgi:Domain of unknown function (DUF4145)